MDPFFEINSVKKAVVHIWIFYLHVLLLGGGYSCNVDSFYGKQNGEHFTTLKHYILKFILHICIVSLLLQF